jgi:phage head maturation protease
MNNNTNTPIKIYHTETFKIERVQNNDGSTKYVLKGNAMPLGEQSRNKVLYRADSVKKAYESLNGVSFLFNHDATKVLGHVINAGLTDSHVTYEADIDPEEKDFIRKSERGDIKNVSVGAMVSNPEFLEDEGVVIVDVDEFVELSSAPVPGFKNTSAGFGNEALMIAESFGNTSFAEKLRKERSDNIMTKQKNESNDELSTEEVLNDLKVQLSEVITSFEVMENRLASVESKIEALVDDVESEESVESDAPEETPSETPAEEPVSEKKHKGKDDEEETDDSEDDEEEGKSKKDKKETLDDLNPDAIDEEFVNDKPVIQQNKSDLKRKEKQLGTDTINFKDIMFKNKSY